MGNAGKRARQVTGKKTGKVAGPVTGPVTAKAVPPPPASTPVLVRPAVKLDDVEVAKIVIESLVAIRTVQRFARGQFISKTNMQRISRALQRLHMKPRPRESDAPPARASTSEQQRVA